MSHCILVVDDDPMIRTNLAHVLAMEGYDVRTADSGTLALELLDAVLPDAVVLDLMMPAMDG